MPKDRIVWGVGRGHWADMTAHGKPTPAGTGLPTAHLFAMPKKRSSAAVYMWPSHHCPHHHHHPSALMPWDLWLHLWSLAYQEDKEYKKGYPCSFDVSGWDTGNGTQEDTAIQVCGMCVFMHVQESIPQCVHPLSTSWPESPELTQLHF
jgi:hypothetical protein